MEWSRSAIHTASGFRGFYTIHSDQQKATIVVNEYVGLGFGEPVTLAKDVTLVKARKIAEEFDRVPVMAG